MLNINFELSLNISTKTCLSDKTFHLDEIGFQFNQNKVLCLVAPAGTSCQFLCRELKERLFLVSDAVIFKAWLSRYWLQCAEGKTKDSKDFGKINISLHDLPVIQFNYIDKQTFQNKWSLILIEQRAGSHFL